MRFNRQFIESLLVHGIAAAKAKESGTAQRYFERILHLPATQYQRQKALYWVSELAEDPIIVREYLEDILIVNPGHRLARRNLAIIDGRLKERDIIDANRYETEIPAEAKDAKDAVTEQDFIKGMATAQGHSFAVSTKAFDCSACGAVYLLPPETLSLTCAQCDSSYTIHAIAEKKIIPPAGIILIVTTRSQAEESLLDNVSEETKNSSIRLESMQGVYLPVWTFDVRGEVPYLYDDEFTSKFSNSTVSISLDDLLVPASKPIPKSFEKMLSSYNIEEIISYETKYLSNWLAETYQI